MKKPGKVVLAILAVLVILFAVGITFTIGWRPFLGPKARPLTSRHFERTPQRLERGRYLFTGVSGCAACHSPHDTSQPGNPVIVSQEGTGADMGVEGLPGRVVAPNLTPDLQTGLGSWSDDAIARAIREGVRVDGRTLFPLMPYENFRHMSDEDLASIIVFMRSLPAAHHELSQTKIVFPVKYLIRSVPQPVTSPVNDPDPNDAIQRGKYLVTMGSCNGCHTPQVRGQEIAGMEYGGGFLLKENGMSAAAANITPDATGISYYDEALFIQALRTGQVGARSLSPIMPYESYRKLTDNDLKEMFAYLRTLKPVKHRVDNTLPATYCKLCRQMHGGGDQN
ncbi:MAG TPA: c-type cytochrome [Terriglobales bacterium]|nr:c-type cytochrome [Terriglobales bacterium]